MLLAFALLAGAQTGPPSLPPGFQLQDRLLSIDRPTAVGFMPDGSLLVAFKTGSVERYLPDSGSSSGLLVPQDEPVLDLNLEVNGTGDRGLLGMALHPAFGTGQGEDDWLYVAYTAAPEPGTDPTYDPLGPFSRGVVERYRLQDDGTGGYDASVASVEVLLGALATDGTAPDAMATITNVHANGSIAFGSDGTLFVAVGDGAEANQVDQGGDSPGAFDDWTDPKTGAPGVYPADQDCGAFRAQDLRSLAGKVLRIDSETGLGLDSNPFYDGDPASLASRVWALGMRNPFQLVLQPGTGSADPALGDPGVLWAGDVGSSVAEELDRIEGGGNYGWPCFEGVLPQALYDGLPPLDPNPHGCTDCSQALFGALRAPALAWDRTDPALAVPQGVWVDAAGAPEPGAVGNCVIVGDVYTGGDYPAEYDGRLFVGDFGAGWIRCLELDAQGDPLLVHGFAEGFETLVDVVRHPTTGNLWIVRYGGFLFTGVVQELVHGAAPAPNAVLAASPEEGPSPLAVSFDAGDSSDPGGLALSYRFDFGDGSPPLDTTATTAQHVYATEGSFTAQVEVTNSAGTSAIATVPIQVGPAAGGVVIVTPEQNAEIEPQSDLLLSGSSSNPAHVLTFTLDLFHNSHVHPGFFIVPGPLASIFYDAHGVSGDLNYYRVNLLGAEPLMPTQQTHHFVYTKGQVRDVTGTMLPVSALDDLVPPTPLGAGNPDHEVLRDGVVPSAATGTALESFTTEHAGDQGADDWLGWVHAEPPPPDARFCELTYTEGPMDPTGGWFESVVVEVLQDGVWVAVQNLNVVPPYPGGSTQPADGFTTYRFLFDPIAGDGVRLRGVPGGTTGFVGSSELRVRAVTPDPSPVGLVDVTDRGTPLAHVLDLAPLPPQSLASTDPQTFVNGTEPPLGSTSLLASFDSFDAAPLAGDDHYGLAFDVLQTFEGARFQEGASYSGGGSFDDLTVEVRATPTGPWVEVAGLTATPDPSAADPALPYESFELRFDPIAGRALRVVGTPSAPGGFASAAELRVFGTEPTSPDCGVIPYGEAFGPFDLEVVSDTPPIQGLPFGLLVRGAPGPGVGLIGLAVDSAEIPLGPGLWLFLDPLSLFTLTLSFDATGEAQFLLPAIQSDPATFGGSIFVQVVHFGLDGPSFSGGTEVAFCP